MLKKHKMEIRYNKGVKKNKINKIDNTTMMIEKNAKFTATMTFNSDKELVQTLRAELNLGEKECMHFLIKVALQNKEALVALATEHNAEVEKEKAEKKVMQIAAYKAKYTEMRALMKVAKEKVEKKKAKKGE